MDALELSTDLFSRLATAGVRYVHWKSNEHLHAALRGETDLDLLVYDADRAAFREVIDGLGFVALQAPTGRHIPGLESYLGFDRPSGSLVHLDVHYRLVLGERLVKNHHLPLEGWLLDGAWEMAGVRTPEPAREFLLLYIRAMLKTSHRQLIRAAVKGGSPLPHRILKEAAWLANRVERGELWEAAASSGLPMSGREIEEFLGKVEERDVGWAYVLRRRRRLIRVLGRFQRRSRLRAGARKLLLRSRGLRPLRRLGLGARPRRLVGTAPFIAVVGADGSGKTRLTRDLETWLGQKVAVRHVYFGQPKKGIGFRLLNKPGSLLRRADAGTLPVLASRVLRPVATSTEVAKWLLLAAQRRQLAARAITLCRSGETVIAERYPLSDFWPMPVPMDGPRLQSDTDVSAWLSRWEMSHYRAIPSPDLVLVLHTDLDTLRSRKVDLSLEEHTAKVEAVAGLSPAAGRVVVDAGRSYGEVLLDAKRSLWRILRETH